MSDLRLGQRVGDEGGAVAVIAAITLTVLVLMAAFVLDIASLRADRVDSKSAADMSSLAAASAYDPVAVDSAQEACFEALAFAAANLRDFDAPVTGSPGCETFATGAACSESTEPRTAVYTDGPYTLRITSPVPYGPLADGYDLMEGLVHDAAHDGIDCDRIGVRITRDRSFRLAGVAGFGGSETTQSSVARWSPGGDEELYASLVILDRQACGTLKNSGNDQGRLIVSSAQAIIDGELTELPGTITVDTIPTSGCSGSNWQNRVIAVQNNGQALVRASGRIFAHGLDQGFDPPRIYWETVVRTDPAATNGLYPRPTAGPAITREPIDHRFNCKATYPTDRAWSPAWTGAVGWPIGGCTGDDVPPPYLENLWNGLRGTVLTPAAAAADASWSVFPDDVGGSCTSASGTYGPGTAHPSTRWYIDCPSSTGQAFAPSGITFRDVEYVVSRNRIELGGGEGNFLTIEGDDDNGAVFFVQNGRLYRTGQARMYLIDTFVYLDDTSDGYVEFGGNNPNSASLNHPGCSNTGQAFGVCWHAPTIDMDGCEGYTSGLPPAACFQPLGLWTNTTTAHDLGGQATFDISGSFFTPNARPFELSGQAEQNFTRAQFFTARLELSGQAPVLMAPNPDTNIPIPIPGTALIR
jgi:hypothetical protein